MIHLFPFLTFFLISATVMGASPVGGPAALPFVLAAAEAASPSEMGTWLIVLFAVAAGLGSVVSLIRLFVPSPALHKQFADRDETKREMESIEKKVDGVLEKLDQMGGKQYDARRRMHRQLNAQGQAIYFMIGRMEAKGDDGAKTLRELLQKAEGEE